MVRTKNILSLWIQPGPVFHRKGHRDQNKHQPGPPAVEPSDQFKFFWKKDRDQQQEEKNYKQNKKNDKAVKSI
jgi:hypothetical protein